MKSAIRVLCLILLPLSLAACGEPGVSKEEAILQHASNGASNTAYIYRPSDLDTFTNRLLFFKDDKSAGQLGAGQMLKLPLDPGVNSYSVMEAGLQGLSTTGSFEVENDNSKPHYLLVVYRDTFAFRQGRVIEVTREPFLEFVKSDKDSTKVVKFDKSTGELILEE